VCVAVGVGTGLWASAASAEGRDLIPVTGPAATHPQIAAAIIAVGVLFAQWALPTVDSLNGGMYGFDTQWYHMPFAVEFASSGEIWPFDYTAPVFLSWFYPANSELLHAAGIVAFGRDLLSPVINLGWLGLALLAAWCIGRPWGVSGWSLLGAGIVLGATVFADQPGDARNDVVALALILSSGALLVNAFPRADAVLRPGPALALAGLAAGLAVGTRLTALAPAAALTVGVIALAPGGARLRAGVAWLVPLAAGGGIWYVRNLFGSGNPLPWIDDVGPVSLPGPDQELGGREPFAVVHYLTDTEIWNDWFYPALDDRLGPLWLPLLLVAAAGAILAVVRGRGALRVLGAAAIVGALAYLVTPVTASGAEGMPHGFASNLRYLTAPLALALALLPVALTQPKGGQTLFRFQAREADAPDKGGQTPFSLVPFGAGVLVVLFASVVIDVDRWPTTYLHAGIAAGIVAAVAVGVAIAVSGGRLSLTPHRYALAAVAVVVAAVVAVAGYSAQERYLDGRYADPAEILPNPGLDTAFKWGRDVQDARIGVTIQRQLPFSGTDLSNEVEFVGVHGPNAGFLRAETCEQWREAVNDGDYDYLVTAVDRAAPGSTFSPREEIWTRGDPAARVIESDGPATIWKLSGPLDPSGC
jgi:hypothetical protein